MTITRNSIVLAGTLFVLSAIPGAAAAQTVDQLTASRVKLESVEYKGKRAIKVTEDGQVENGEAYAIVKGPGISQRDHRRRAGRRTCGERRGPRTGIHRRGVPDPRRQVRVHLPASDQRPRRRPGTPQPFHAVQLVPGLRLRTVAQGGAGKVRELCGSRTWRLDPGPDCRAGHDRAAVRPRSGAARADRERSEAG